MIPVEQDRIFLSPPHLTGQELELIAEALASGWVAPLGPFVTRFEEEFAEKVGVKHALAVSSGTAALHLALMEAGVGPGDEVLVSTFTFAASINPILYVGAVPVLIDSERESWNIDPQLLREALEEKSRHGRTPKAMVVVHVFGQSANMDEIVPLCEQYGVTLIEDAAEALGATYNGAPVGGFGLLGVFSFNGNKIMTTSGGGMLVSNDAELIHHARKVAAQAREPAVHYEHAEVGYNYRMSNILAAVGVAQLSTLEDRVLARRRVFEAYYSLLEDIPGIEFMPDPRWGLNTRWLTCILIDPEQTGVDPETIRLTLERENIEARPTWKPMHLQPAYRRFEQFGGEVAEDLFARGLCLPSGSNLTLDEVEKVAELVRRCVYEPLDSPSPVIPIK